MKIQRTLPPAASPVHLNNLLHGLTYSLSGKKQFMKLEEELKAYFNARHVFLVSSGKSALTLILNALKSLSPTRSQVLIPAYTCFSVPSAIVKAGLEVSLCDIDPSSFDFDYKSLGELIQGKTLCVIPNHLFGIPSDMDRINRLCKEEGVFVVEDGAQAMGGVYRGKKLGTMGDVGFFSLARGKNITCGSGGIIVTNSDPIASAIDKEVSCLKNPKLMETIKEFLKMIGMSIFIRPSLYWFPSGLSFLRLGETVFHKEFPIKRLSGMQAGFLRGWQKKLEESNRIRQENAEYFLERLGLRSKGRESNGVSIPYLRLPVLLKNRRERDQLFVVSNNKGSGLSLMYPTPINEIKEIKDRFDGKIFPSAKRVSETLLTIPTHGFITDKDKEELSQLFDSHGLISATKHS